MYSNFIQQSKQDDYFQSIRGLCILCVVLIHCATGIMWKGHAVFNFNYDYWLILRQFINFPIALFIFLSAFFIKIEQASKKPFLFLSNRLQRLLIPYLLWSIIYIVINTYISGTTPKVTSVLFAIMTGRSAGPLYFIIVLLQLTLIAPLIINNINKKWFNIICCMITPIYLIILYTYNYFTKQQMPYYETLFVAWFWFYYAGIYMKMHGFTLKTSGNEIFISIALMSTALLASMFECYLLLSLDLSVIFASSQIKISSFLYASALLIMIFVIRKYSSSPFHKLLVYLGDYSYGIFYVHTISLLIVYKIIQHIPYIQKILPLDHCVSVSLTIVLCVISIKTAKQLLGNKVSKYLFGF